MHLFDNIASPNELSLDIELRNSGPVRVFLDSFTDILISKDINILIVAEAVVLKHLDDIVGETTSGHLFASFHEKHDVIALDPFGKLCI
jgi:hypothetical protein